MPNEKAHTAQEAAEVPAEGAFATADVSPDMEAQGKGEDEQK